MNLMYLPPVLLIILFLLLKVVADLWFISACFKAGFLWGLGLILFPVAIGAAGWMLPAGTTAQAVQPVLVIGSALYYALLLVRHWDLLRGPFILGIFSIFALAITVVGSIFLLRSNNESVPGFIKRTRAEWHTVSDRLAKGPFKKENFSLSKYITAVVKLTGKEDPNPDATRSIFSYFSSSDAAKESDKAPVETYTALSKEEIVFSAIRDGTLERVGLLIGSSDLDWNKPSVRGQTPLTFAVLLGNPSMVRKLLELGLDPCARNAKQQEPIELARLQNLPEVQKVLEEYLSRQKLRDLVHSNRVDQIRSSLQKDAAINEHSAQGETPLMEAAALGYQQTVESLIRGGADLNAVNEQGQTALDLARENGRDAIVRLLEEAMKK